MMRCALIAALALMLPVTGYGALPMRACRVLVLADARARDGHVFRDAGELGDALALLSLWGVPYDLLRLDTQMLRTGDLLDGTGKPAYGVIVWTVRTDLLPRQFQEGQLLRDACLKQHVSLIALGGRIEVPAVQEILGLRVLGWKGCRGPLTTVDPSGFLLRDEGRLPQLADEPWCASGPVVEPASPQTTVVLRAGDQPLVTARTLDAASGARAVWLGGDANCLLRGGGSGLGIRLFRRALVWSLGALVVHDYDNTLLLRMDDPGTAQSSYLRGWNYPSLSPSVIRQKILVPLREHHARLDVFCCPGYVDAKTDEVLHSEQVDRVDPFGDREDLRDTFATLREGQKEGLIEIESHGWTHMDPDLDTPIPGSTDWWTGSVSTEWADYRWYREFFDRRRNRDVPPEVQLQHMRTSCDWLAKYFGLRPLAFCPPGHAISGDSWIYPRTMTGTVEVRVDGAEKNASYLLFLGEGHTWITVGQLHADAEGAIRSVLPAPAEIWLEGKGYFTINRVGGRTHFVAGPAKDPLGFDFSLPVRDKVQMKAFERQEFPEASPSICQGWIMGHLNKGTYQPPLRAAACTYRVAARAGFALVIDTACHDLDSERVITLRMVPVVSSVRGIEPAISCRSDVPTIFRFHNRDLILNPDYLVHILQSLSEQGGPANYLSAEELAGYLHAQWTVRPGPDNCLVAVADYRSPACRYLRSHDSDWTLLATDEVLSALGGAHGPLILQDEGGTNRRLMAAAGRTGTIQFHVPAGKDTYTFTFRGSE
jgi:hypothetical protein